MEKKRIEYLDVLKALGIFFVICNHTALLPEKSLWGNLLMTVSYSAVPCFMMVTGGLMHRPGQRSWKRLFLKAGRVYLLLCFWKVCYLLFYDHLYPGEYSWMGLIRYVFFFGSFDNVNTGLFWYLHVYLFVLLCFPVTDLLFRGGKRSRAGLLAMGVLGFGLKYFLRVRELLFGYSPFLERLQVILPYTSFFFFFVIGAFLFEERERILAFGRKRPQNPWLFCFLFLMGAAALTLEKYRQTGSFFWENVHVSGAYFRISTVVMSVGLYLTVLWAGKVRPLQWLAGQLGPYTMGIYVLHGLAVPCVQLFVYARWPDQLSLGLELSAAVLILLFCAAVTRLLRRIPAVRWLVM